jgi:hypothetical protein
LKEETKLQSDELKDKEQAIVEQSINSLQIKQLELDSKICRVEKKIKVEINI